MVFRLRPFYSGTVGQKIGGIGFYCEAYEHGHYLGRDREWYVGSPSFKEGDVQKNKARFFVDRGGSSSNLADLYTIPLFEGRQDNVFTWHLEQVTDDGNIPSGTNVYYLSIYMPNQRDSYYEQDYGNRTKDNTPFYKHYVKFEQINPYGDQKGGFYALTTGTCNEGTYGQSGDKGFLSDDQIKVTDHEVTPKGADKEDYYWQIITRKDIKEKFLKDQEDPFAAKTGDGNATLFIENPDFSRALQKTVNTSGEGATPPSFWHESSDDVYNFPGNEYNSEFYGRYTFMHPKNNGTLTQTFKPSQYGLFRLDVSGYVFRQFDSQVSAKMELQDVSTNSKKVVIGSAVDIDPIAYEDALQIFGRMGELAKGGKKDYNDLCPVYDKIKNMSIFKYTADGTETDSRGVKIEPGYSAVYAYDNYGEEPVVTSVNETDFNNKKINIVVYVDSYGRVYKGLYLKGDYWRNDRNLGPCEGQDGTDKDYSYVIDNGDWVNTGSGSAYLTVEVNVGQEVKFGPQPTGSGSMGTDDRLQWWTPKSVKDERNNKRELTIENVSLGDAGDYFLTYRDGDKWNVVCYRLVVKDDNLQLGTPGLNYVKLDGNNPYKLNNFVSVSTEQATSRPYESQVLLQSGIAATNTYFVERAVGEFLYDDQNTTYRKSIFFYVPDGAQNNDLKITLTFDGIDNGNLKDLIALDNVRLTYIGDMPYVMDEGARADVYTGMTPAQNGDKFIPVYINRTFSADAWNAFVCPIYLSYGQLKEAFGMGVQVSEINSADALNRESPYIIMFKSLISESTDDNEDIIKPGRFYLVKPSSLDPDERLDKIDADRGDGGIGYSSIRGVTKRSGNFVFLGRHNLTGAEYTNPKDGKKYKSELLTGDNPYSKEGDYSTLVATDISGLNANDPYRNFEATFGYKGTVGSHNDIKLHGSYFPQEIQNRANSYVFATKDSKTALVHLNASPSAGGPTTLQGYRFYIEDVEKTSGNAKPFTFVVDGVADDDEFSGINSAVSVAADNGDIYTISGQKVSGTLLKGVYVKSGKKFLVK